MICLSWFSWLKWTLAPLVHSQPGARPWEIREEIERSILASRGHLKICTKIWETGRLTRRCFIVSEYLRPRGTIYRVALWRLENKSQGGCKWAAVTYFVVDQSTPFFHYLVEESCLYFNNPFLYPPSELTEWTGDILWCFDSVRLCAPSI